MGILTENIQRHKTAIRRAGFSLPVKCLLRDGLLDQSKDFFDFGCGHGQDIELLSDIDISCSGWDPVHRPTGTKKPADIVNIGYVINVIEHPEERTEAVQQAWSLCRRVLTVAAQLDSAAGEGITTYADGIVTSRGTFQKYYKQAELRLYLEDVLGVAAVPAAPGVFYIFREEEDKQAHLARRYRRLIAVPRKRISEIHFDKNREILEPFLGVLSRLGRLPNPDEIENATELIARFGSLKKAFTIVRRVTGSDVWEEIARQRTEDLLVHLALARFHRRPPLSKLPRGMQYDVKAFFGTYEKACREADTLLFKAGDASAIDEACQASGIGQLVENGLLIHYTAIGRLNPLLRIYEGCARALIGEAEEAQVIKLHRSSGKVSYLSFHDFETDNAPHMKTRVKVALRSLEVDVIDYSRWETPPLLEDKTGLLPADSASTPEGISNET